MSIDFSLSPELEAIRLEIRNFIGNEVKPVEEIIERDKLDQTDRDQYVSLLVGHAQKGLLRRALASAHAKRLGRDGSRTCRISHGPS